jgi:hypothetical protein
VHHVTEGQIISFAEVGWTGLGEKLFQVDNTCRAEIAYTKVLAWSSNRLAKFIFKLGLVLRRFNNSPIKDLAIQFMYCSVPYFTINFNVHF